MAVNQTTGEKWYRICCTDNGAQVDCSEWRRVEVATCGVCTPVAAPVVPPFNPTVTINPGQNAQAIVDAAAPGTHIRVAAGTHNNWEDVRPKAGMVIRGDGVNSTLLEGSGKGYCVRSLSSANGSDVTIGGFTAQNYGFGGTAQNYACIQTRDTDTLNGQFTYDNVNNWFIHDMLLLRNGANGVRLGDNTTVYRVETVGHNVTGMGGDRCVGGLIHTCVFSANSLNPASGSASNGANFKTGWHNADRGRTLITPIDRPKADFYLVNSTFNATDPRIGNGTFRCPRGIWYDLDCQYTFTQDNVLNDHPNLGIFHEASNYGEVKCNVVNNSDGFGQGLNQDFVNGALCCGESTNILFEGNEVNDSNFALINRMSNRSSDFTSPTVFQNYAYQPGPRYWIDAPGPAPIPAIGDTANIWTGNNTFRCNTLNNCNRVLINEGTEGGTHGAISPIHGSTDLGSIVFEDNDYSGSPSIRFSQVSNAQLTLAQWQALPYTRDQ